MNRIDSLLKHVFLRPANRGDINFVLSYWIEEESEKKTKLERQAGFRQHNKLIIEYLLNTSKTMILSSHTDKNLSLGFITYRDDTEIPVVNMIFIKKIYRNNGLVDYMLDEVFKGKTFNTILFTSAPHKWQLEWIYNNGYEINEKIPAYKFVSSLLKEDDKSLTDFTATKKTTTSAKPSFFHKKSGSYDNNNNNNNNDNNLVKVYKRKSCHQ